MDSDLQQLVKLGNGIDNKWSKRKYNDYLKSGFGTRGNVNNRRNVDLKHEDERTIFTNYVKTILQYFELNKEAPLFNILYFLFELTISININNILTIYSSLANIISSSFFRNVVNVLFVDCFLLK